MAGCKVGKRHFVCAANARIQLVHLAGVAVGRKPLGHGIGIKECTINALWSGPDNAMQANGICWHDLSWMAGFWPFGKNQYKSMPGAVKEQRERRPKEPTFSFFLPRMEKRRVR